MEIRNDLVLSVRLFHRQNTTAVDGASEWNWIRNGLIFPVEIPWLSLALYKLRTKYHLTYAWEPQKRKPIFTSLGDFWTVYPGRAMYANRYNGRNIRLINICDAEVLPDSIITIATSWNLVSNATQFPFKLLYRIRSKFPRFNSLCIQIYAFYRGVLYSCTLQFRRV